MGFAYSNIQGPEAAAIAVVLGVMLVFYLLILAFSVTSYILGARGMQVIAKRRGIRHSWLAWIPLGNAWILGSISDQYQYVVKGKVRNRRKLLLILDIVLILGGLPVYIMSALSSLSAIGISTPDSVAVGMFALAMLGAGLLILVLSIVTMIFLYMAYYDLYVSCDPHNAVAFLVLSIFVSVTMPFFVFACRKKDLGMPARKEAQPESQVVALPVQLDAPEAEVPAEESVAAETPAEEAPVDEAPAEDTASPEEN